LVTVDARSIKVALVLDQEDGRAGTGLREPEQSCAFHPRSHLDRKGRANRIEAGGDFPHAAMQRHDDRGRHPRRRVKAGQTADRFTQSPGSRQRQVLPVEVDDPKTLLALPSLLGNIAVWETPLGYGVTFGQVSACLL